MQREIKINLRYATLYGDIAFENEPKAWVIFVHGSGSSRHSLRNTWVARKLNQHNYGTFLFDLLTENEDQTYANRFNIPLLADRLIKVTNWFMSSSFYNREPIAFYGASTGAAAALMAVGESLNHDPIFAVISRGGRPDLTDIDLLHKISRPVLLLVGKLDYDVIELNKLAKKELKDVEMELIPGATHLFEEPGALDLVVEKTLQWLDKKLPHGKFHEEHGSL